MQFSTVLFTLFAFVLATTAQPQTQTSVHETSEVVGYAASIEQIRLNELNGPNLSLAAKVAAMLFPSASPEDHGDKKVVADARRSRRRRRRAHP
ncbi:hypothetical protein BD410DRAFT_781651 [Rickenella mellea]|uniref:Uncharacterized protein n=1 Tax=Rickenella mellea TaxID=50990 RepID=A0A4Y7QKL3_9AGAM|nr:hypothetical protein BD410DRAFT_781651 [Rickenella mellea]